jgi:hypothetical protein
MAASDVEFAAFLAYISLHEDFFKIVDFARPRDRIGYRALNSGSHHSLCGCDVLVVRPYPMQYGLSGKAA